MCQARSKEACGIHDKGTAGNHKKVICPRDDQGRKCEYDFYYACTPHTHAYSGPALLPCGHEKGSPGSHKKTYHRRCGHTDWHCLGAGDHNYVACPRDTDGGRCRADRQFPGYHLPCDTSHVHQYPSDLIKKQPCGHTYDPGSSSAYSHRLITCPTQNGKSCSYGSYYACSPHTHAYPSDPPPKEKTDPTPTDSTPPTPTPPTDSTPTDSTPTDPPPQTVTCANSYQGSGACIYNRVVSAAIRMNI